ncbi:MAG: hypothetical protein IJT62_08050 [Oscillospiraceae bacterium]|nr:hypothetical protein [Oscillospiraceae bacterium]
MNKLEERLQLFHTQIAHKETNRIPLLSNFWSWKILDSGYKLSEALYDTDILMKSLCVFQERYNFDTYYETNWRNPLFLSRSMGSVNYIIDDINNSISYLDQTLMDASDYDALIDNPEKYYWTSYIPRKYPNASIDDIKNTLLLFMQFLDFFGKGPQTLAEKYDVPVFAENGLFCPLENLGCGMRGLKEFSIDIRRRPDKVEAAVEALNHYTAPIKSLYATTKPGMGSTVVGAQAVMLSHTLMNTKTFERFYMPFIKELAAYLEAYDKTGFLFMEGDNTRLWDCLKDLPKGMFMVCMENDDIYEAKKAIGDTIALAGGLKATTLGTGTPELCIEEAKRAVDELGVGGGFVVTTDKMISFASDCRRENIKAVTDFLTGYYK